MVQSPTGRYLNITKTVWDYMKRQKQLAAEIHTKTMASSPRCLKKPNYQVHYKTLHCVSALRNIGAALKANEGHSRCKTNEMTLGGEMP